MESKGIPIPFKRRYVSLDNFPAEQTPEGWWNHEVITLHGTLVIRCHELVCPCERGRKYRGEPETS